MKKTYIAPLTEVVKMASGEMLQSVSNFGVKASAITGSEGGFQKAGKDDFDDDETVFDELW